MTGTLVPTNRQAPDFGRVVEAFVARDYTVAAHAAGDFVHQAGPLQGIQLGLISLRRIGATREARRLAKVVIDRVRDEDPWSSDLVALALGDRPAEDVLTSGMNPVELCQARFYSGTACATDGRTEEAARQFDSCIKSGAACLELYLAKIERADLEGTG